jgi:flagellar protein FliJ
LARRFRYRFETLLKIRAQREEHHQRVVAERLRQITGVRAQLAALGRQIEEEVDTIRSAQAPGRLDLQGAMRHRHWLSHLNRAELETQGRLGFLEARLAQERAVLAEAMKQRRILEKLKERQAERHRLAEELRGRKEADEMAIARYAFKGIEN